MALRNKPQGNAKALQNNLGGVNIAYFDKTNDSARLDKVEAYVLAALKVLEVAAPCYEGGKEQLQQIARCREATG